MKPYRFAAHSRLVQDIATRHGWLSAARYTNLRDVKQYEELGFLDIDWKNYSFQRHLDAATARRPKITIARDIVNIDQLPQIIDEADALLEHCENVALVPKDTRLAHTPFEATIPSRFLLAYSVPSRYGGTSLSPELFDRPTHLLGGSPQAQLALAPRLDVFSFDCNRFTIDAKFGDYFDGQRFVRDRGAGYRACLERSVLAINEAWQSVMGEGLENAA